MGTIDRNRIFINLPADQLLAITAYGEAGQEGGEGMMAVLNVIRNRTFFTEFYDSEVYEATGSPYHAVVLKPYQFSIFNLDNPVRPTIERIARNFDEELSRNRNLQIAYNLAQMLVRGGLADNTGGATHYHAYYIQPEWAYELQFTTQVGSHLFYTSKPGFGVSIAGIGTEDIFVFVMGGVIFALLYGQRR